MRLRLGGTHKVNVSFKTARLSSKRNIENAVGPACSLSTTPVSLRRSRSRQALPCSALHLRSHWSLNQAKLARCPSGSGCPSFVKSCKRSCRSFEPFFELVSEQMSTTNNPAEGPLKRARPGFRHCRKTHLSIQEGTRSA